MHRRWFCDALAACLPTRFRSQLRKRFALGKDATLADACAREHKRRLTGTGRHLCSEPVREAIHSSFVCTNLDKSLFVRTIFGTAEPTP